jgi:hypothetical protein
MTYTDLYLDAYTSGQNQNQQVAVQKAIQYGQIRFGDKGALATLGRFLIGPEGAALAWIVSIATSADPDWADQLAQAGKAVFATCQITQGCGYPSYLPPAGLAPPVVVPTPTPAVVPPDPDPSAQDVPLPEGGGGNRDSVPVGDEDG